MVRVFKVSPNVQKLMIDYYKDFKREKTPPYAIFQADSADVVVTLYESGKAMFQGVSADIEAQLWIDQEKHLNNITIDNTSKKEKKEETKTFFNFSTIGSDEVGTGDYFGPIVVSATYVSKENISFLEELGVRDSKKITDDKIIEIAPKIILVFNSLLILFISFKNINLEIIDEAATDITWSSALVIKVTFFIFSFEASIYS